MAQPVDYAVQEGVAFIAIDNPPVNALGRDVRAALMDHLDRAEEEDDVIAIVLMGKGKTFPAGADIAEVGAVLDDPSLADLCDRIEGCDIPVIAALHGTALGGGFEMALAAHYRIAVKSTRVGLPEVRLGLTPVGGGTQRAPRLAGAQAALEMMLTGRMFPADRPPAQVFFDAVAEGDLKDVALRFAKTLVAQGRGPRRSSALRTGFADPAAYQAEIARRRRSLANQPETAPLEILSAVEAAQLLPFESGMALEETAFRDCLASDQSVALRHAFIAERRAERAARPEGSDWPQIGRMAVLGGGTTAMQLVVTGLMSGLAVHWGTRDPRVLREGVAQARQVLDRAVARQAMTEEQAAGHMARLKTGDSGDMVAGADVILHAAPGQGNVPAPDDIVRIVAMPGRVDAIGLRFAPPVYAAHLVEVIQGHECSASEIATALALAKRLHKVPVAVCSSGDTIAGRIMAAYQRAADALVDLGQSPYTIDRAMRRWGWPRAPFELSDALGLTDLAKTPRAAGAANWAGVMVAAGRAGRAAGKGWYDWSGGAAAEDPEAMRHVQAMRRDAAPMPPARIVRLVLGAIANEGARMVASGMAARPSDIDVVLMLSQDFPRWRGGPMMAVGLEGLFAVAQDMRRLGHPDTGFWTPEPVWAELIKNGQIFEALNR